LAQALTPREVGRELDGVLDRLLQTSGINYIPMVSLEGAGDLLDAVDHVFYRNEAIPSFDYEIFLQMMPHCERDFFTYEELMAIGTLDLERMVGQSPLRRTFTYNEFYRPLGIEHQVVSPLPSGGGSRGFVCACRAPGSERFSDEEIQCVQRLARAAGRALDAHAVCGPEAFSPEVDATVRALGYLPQVAVLFAPDGRVRWLSDEALLWLEEAGVRVGGLVFLLCRPRRLELLAEVARRIWREPAASLDLLEPPWSAALAPTERLTARRVPAAGGDPGGVLICVASSGTQPSPDRALEPQWLRRWGLTAREAEVAGLIAQGYSLASTAARLGISSDTVHTHVKRIYGKLNVFNRAELTYKLLTELPPGGGGGRAGVNTDADAVRDQG
jgi:DNA-binding CsgD family transcriptional regulator